MRGRGVVTTRYTPQPYPLSWGVQPFNPGEGSGPRTSATGEIEAACPRIWPSQYAWRLMGLGAMPRFALGYTTPTFDNQLSPYSPGYQVIIPGITRTPFGG